MTFGRRTKLGYVQPTRRKGTPMKCEICQASAEDGVILYRADPSKPWRCGEHYEGPFAKAKTLFEAIMNLHAQGPVASSADDAEASTPSRAPKTGGTP